MIKVVFLYSYLKVIGVSSLEHLSYKLSWATSPNGHQVSAQSQLPDRPQVLAASARQTI